MSDALQRFGSLVVGGSVLTGFCVQLAAASLLSDGGPGRIILCGINHPPVARKPVLQAIPCSTGAISLLTHRVQTSSSATKLPRRSDKPGELSSRET